MNLNPWTTREVPNSSFVYIPNTVLTLLSKTTEQNVQCYILEQACFQAMSGLERVAGVFFFLSNNLGSNTVSNKGQPEPGR